MSVILTPLIICIQNGAIEYLRRDRSHELDSVNASFEFFNLESKEFPKNIDESMSLCNVVQAGHIPPTPFNYV